jgi:hypothetical protein
MVIHQMHECIHNTIKFIIIIFWVKVKDRTECGQPLCKEKSFLLKVLRIRIYLTN